MDVLFALITQVSGSAGLLTHDAYLMHTSTGQNLLGQKRFLQWRKPVLADRVPRRRSIKPAYLMSTTFSLTEPEPQVTNTRFETSIHPQSLAVSYY